MHIFSVHYDSFYFLKDSTITVEYVLDVKLRPYKTLLINFIIVLINLGFWRIYTSAPPFYDVRIYYSVSIFGMSLAMN